MRNVIMPAVLIAAIAIGLCVASCHAAEQPQTPTIVKMYGVFEVTLTCDAKFDNPFSDAAVSAEFISPAGKQIKVEGFYYGGNEWRVRFSPQAEGTWKYSATMTGKGITEQNQSGSFECKGKFGHGPVRISKLNKYRFEYRDGTPFYPIGVQTYSYFEVGFDGPWREKGTRAHRAVPAAKWCKEFEGVVNIVRWQLGQGTTLGGALPIIPKGGPADRYDTELAARMDDLLALQKSHGMSHIMILFQDIGMVTNKKYMFGGAHDVKEYKSLKAKNLPQQEQYIRYMVARFGCYVDIWELFNEEAWAPGDYLEHLAKVVHQTASGDPIVTTNLSHPRAQWCQTNTWHDYVGVPANEVDIYLAKELARFKTYNKPILNTEFGNQGTYSNYDPLKWRIAAWAAYMNESNILFWCDSGKKIRPPSKYSNAYIGPETRQSLRVLNEFTKDLPVDMRPVDIMAYTGDVRIFTLSNGDVTVVYAHHHVDHTKTYEWKKPLLVQTGNGTFNVKWINPADGKVVKTEQIATESQMIRLEVPPVTIDLACRIDRIE